MKLTDIPVDGYEHVVRCDDPHNHLTAIISIHDTTLGPALGGLRMWPYLSEQEALTDVNRLAKGMTYKSAVAETGFGGGKAVIIGNPKENKSDNLLRAMGRFIDALSGTYITAEDVGISVDDMVVVRQETQYVKGLPREWHSSGNPSPFTALGVFLGMQVCLKTRLHIDRFTGIRVAVQGCGSVAGYLCNHLHQAGADLIVTDVSAEKASVFAERYGARVVAPADIYQVACDIYAPCALGGTLNDQTISQLQCKIVAGSANNQCLNDEHSDQLRERDILYAPDFVINAGGIINIAVEMEPSGYNEARAEIRVRHIASVLHDIFKRSAHDRISTHLAAQRLAQDKLAGTRTPASHVTGL